MKHTPGPWSVNDSGDTLFIEGLRNGEGVGIAFDLYDEDIEPTLEELYANAHLIASAPELLEEHKHWAIILGHILVEALQGNYKALEVYAKHMKIEYRDGEPWAKSEAIAKAEGRI